MNELIETIGFMKIARLGIYYIILHYIIVISHAIYTYI